MQAVHTDIRDELAAALIPLLAKDGDLLCIGRTRLENDNLENKTGPPWPLKKTWLENWFSEFTLIGYNSIVDLNDGDNQRYRANFKNIIN
ncbi:MAG: hypothetical protein ACKVI6_00345 [Candidatus Poseidoniales archaeon]